MGAVAPVNHWNIEDDILLKNALEAGASLESLAKGAVQFSKRFSVQELDDRWQSLLYDPVVSAEASACMIKIDQPFTLPGKSSKGDGTKVSKDHQLKRKFESIRNCYYAMFKRIRRGTSDSTDMNFLAGSGVSNYGDGHVHTSADCLFGNSGSDHLEILDSNPEVMHQALPDLGVRCVSAAASDVNNGATFCSDGNISFPQNDVGQSISPLLEGSFSCAREPCTVEEFVQPNEVPVSNLFEAEDLEVKNENIFGQIAERNGISKYSASFHNFELSSPSQAPVWNSMGGVFAPTLPEIDLRLKEDFTNTNTNTSSVYGNLHPSANCSDEMTTLSPKAAEIIAQLSDHLMDFSDQDDLLDGVDESYFDTLGSLLLDSPSESEMPISGASEASIAPDEYLTLLSSELPGELSDKGLYHPSDQCMVRISEEKLLSRALSVNPDFPEYRNGVICCMLNTEDPDIPNNDDVFLPVHLPSSSFSSLADWKFHEAHCPIPSSFRDIPTHQKANLRGPHIRKGELDDYKQTDISSQIMSSSLSSGMGSNNATAGCGVKLELPQSNAQNDMLRGATMQGASQIKSPNGNANCFVGGYKQKDVHSDPANNQNYHPIGSSQENKAKSHDNVPGVSKTANSSKLEGNASLMLHNELVLHSELSSSKLSVPIQEENPTLSDAEEYLESDDDLPNFSDVEAMILDMDLSPDDHGRPSKNAFRYQDEESKRTIIRLEQAADACMQRALQANGAFAVLYGHHSKHFIKKTEVLIGRSTEDIKVDIDLRGESQGNKISRRQAKIMLGMAGSFYLKNLGKFSIHVNGVEVAPNQSESLTSGCLIEVRGVALIFETNRSRIKQHMDTNTKEAN